MPTSFGPEEGGPDLGNMRSQVVEAEKVDREYGAAILELADDGQTEFDLSYVQK